MAAATARGAPDTSRRGWFAVPGPVRELFRAFPLAVHPSEPLPARAPAAAAVASSAYGSPPARPRLYVFSGSDEDAARGRPSFNPSCLKWQTFLRIAGVQVDLVPSNNHASPSGSLPFLILPPSSSSSSPSSSEVPLTGSKIGTYARARSTRPATLDVSSPRAEAYLALVAQNIRPAWLHALYLVPENEDLLRDLYLAGGSSSSPSIPLLRAPLLSSLRAAAAQQILAATRRPTVDAENLLAAAADAFAALSTALEASGDEHSRRNQSDGANDGDQQLDDGNNENDGDRELQKWFFGNPEPSLFDAEVFAYTHLILGGAGASLGAWRDDALARCLAGFPALVAHREALYRRYWGDDEARV